MVRNTAMWEVNIHLIKSDKTRNYSLSSPARRDVYSANVDRFSLYLNGRDPLRWANRIYLLLLLLFMDVYVGCCLHNYDTGRQTCSPCHPAGLALRFKKGKKTGVVHRRSV